MTKEEALTIWLPVIKMGVESMLEFSEALDMAIKALEQNPCTDAISREELLKELYTWDEFGYTETGCFVREPKVAYINYDDVVKCIKGMPSVTPSEKVGQWIPVSERLPEVGIDVLICDMEGTIYLSHRSSSNHYFDEWGNKIKNIRAWMPLPEPYKQEVEE